MRHHPRLDSNQRAIVAELRKLGCGVQSLASVGGGCPDLLVARDGVNYLFEVKDGSKPLSRRALTPAEQLWRERWPGQVATVESLGDAMREIGIEGWEVVLAEEVLP